MSQYSSQVQNQFLSQVRKKHQRVEVILETGRVLHGKVKSFDQFSISLAFKGSVEIIYKSSIIYIAVLPRRPKSVRTLSGSRANGSTTPTEVGKLRHHQPPVLPTKSLPDFDKNLDIDPPPPKKPVRKYF